MDIDEIFAGLREPREAPGGQARVYARQGATIGDGMQTAARVGGFTAIAALLLNAAPLFIAAVAGIIFMVHGCVTSTFTGATPEPLRATEQPAPRPVQAAASPPRNITTALTAPQPRQPVQHQSLFPEPGARPAPAVAPRDASRSATVDAIAAPRQETMPAPVETVPNPRRFALGGLTPEGVQPGSSPDGTRFEWREAIEIHPDFDSSFFASSGRGGRQGGGLMGQEFPMSGLLGGPASGREPRDAGEFTPEDSPLFDVQKGKKYFGTSQQPGNPSCRISLTIESIHDHGSNLRARIEMLGGLRTSRTFDGYVDVDENTIVLIPVASPGSFGTFVTHSPWHSQSPTRITLEVLGGGKRLSGESYSGERFELTQQDSARPPMPSKPSGNGGGSVDLGGAPSMSRAWDLVRRNGRAISPSERSAWVFFHEQDHRGTVEWMRGDQVIASGTYRDHRNGRDIDITLSKDGATEFYPGIFMLLANEPGTVRIAIPNAPGAERLTSMSASNSNRFDLKPRQSR